MANQGLSKPRLWVGSFQSFGDEDGCDADTLADLGHALEVAVVRGGALGRGEGAGNDAAAEAGPEGGEEVYGVSGEEEDPVAWVYAALLQGGEDREGTLAQLGVGQTPFGAALVDLDQRAVALRGAGELPGQGGWEAVRKRQRRPRQKRGRRR